MESGFCPRLRRKIGLSEASGGNTATWVVNRKGGFEMMSMVVGGNICRDLTAVHNPAPTIGPECASYKHEPKSMRERI